MLPATHLNLASEPFPLDVKKQSDSPDQPGVLGKKPIKLLEQKVSLDIRLSRRIWL